MTLYIPDQQSDCVVDVSHWQGKPDWANVKAQNPGLRGVIAKASQGIHVDPSWDWNSREIGPVGLMPGAYHFVTNIGAEDQVDTFLAAVQPGLGILVALDWEPAGNAPLEVVETMVELIFDRIGRYPVMYLGRTQISRPNDVLSKCDLWLPEYGTKPITPPGWDKWRLHQHTDGSLGDNTGPIIGIGRADRSYYDDTQGPIEEWWGGGVSMGPK